MKIVFLALLSFLICFLGCQKKDVHLVPSQKNHRILKIGLQFPVRSLHPRIGCEQPSCLIISMLFEGLMKMGKQDEIIPGVAERYTISEDGLTYTFYLRPTKWSNGDSLTAYDFEYAWKKSIDPCFAQVGSFHFYVIKNVEKCVKGELGVDEVGIQALDEKTLVVELEHPAPYFLSMTTFSTYMPICKKVELKNKCWAECSGRDWVSNGPFVLKHWKKGNTLSVRKNQNYWNAKEVGLPGIDLCVIEDGMTAFYLFEKKEIDWVGKPFSSLPSEICSSKRHRKMLKTQEGLKISWIFINTQDPFLNNKNLRKALTYALDRKKIVEHILQGGEKAALGILPSKLALQKEPYFKNDSREKAQNHFTLALQELGYTQDNFPSLTFNIATGTISSRISQALQEQWREVLGIEVIIDKMDWPVFFTKVSKGNYQMGMMSWVSWLYDPIYFLGTFRTKSLPSNMSFWENSIYQRLLDFSDKEVDHDKRQELLKKAENLLMEELPIIPLYFPLNHYIKSPKLKGVNFSMIDQIDFSRAYFEN